MNSFPNIIKIKILDHITQAPVNAMVMKIRLFANQKNDYSFILPLSDRNGNIVITKKWLENEIEKEQRLFPMDYSSNLSNCKSEFILSILDEEAINRAITAMCLFQKATQISDEYINQYTQTSNWRYCSKELCLVAEGKDMDVLINV